MFKTCPLCGNAKPLSEFHKCCTHPDGRHSWCKTCSCDYRRAKYRGEGEEWLANHPRIVPTQRKGKARSTEPYMITQANGYIVRVRWSRNRQVREYVHRRNWTQAFGPIPPGYAVHHIDGDRANNHIDNLRAMPLCEHSRQHNLGIRQKKHVPCTNCDRHTFPRKDGLCCHCRSTLRLKGKLHEPLHKKYAGPCLNCGRTPLHSKGLCHSCYSMEWVRKTGYKPPHKRRAA